MYFDELLPRLVKKGSDGNAGSSALCDTTCLQVQMIFMLNPPLSFMVCLVPLVQGGRD
jgi:hypothetical protein